MQGDFHHELYYLMHIIFKENVTVLNTDTHWSIIQYSGIGILKVSFLLSLFLENSNWRFDNFPVVIKLPNLCQSYKFKPQVIQWLKYCLLFVIGQEIITLFKPFANKRNMFH